MGFSIISSGQAVFNQGHICLQSASWLYHMLRFRP